MMKLVNRLLIIAVIAFGAWFLIQHWDSVEAPAVEENDDGGEVIFEIENNGEEELVLDLDSDLSLEEQLESLRKKPSTTLSPGTIRPKSSFPSIEKSCDSRPSFRTKKETVPSKTIELEISIPPSNK